MPAGAIRGRRHRRAGPPARGRRCCPADRLMRPDRRRPVLAGRARRVRAPRRRSRPSPTARRGVRRLAHRSGRPAGRIRLHARPEPRRARPASRRLAGSTDAWPPGGQRHVVAKRAKPRLRPALAARNRPLSSGSTATTTPAGTSAGDYGYLRVGRRSDQHAVRRPPRRGAPDGARLRRGDAPATGAAGWSVDEAGLRALRSGRSCCCHDVTITNTTQSHPGG